MSRLASFKSLQFAFAGVLLIACGGNPSVNKPDTGATGNAAGEGAGGAADDDPGISLGGALDGGDGKGGAPDVAPMHACATR